MHNFLNYTIDEYFVFNFRRNRGAIIGLIICFSCGLVMGLLLGGKGLYVDAIFSDSINFTILIITNQINLMTIIFRGVIISLQLFALIFVFSLSIYFFPLNFILIIYRGYILGAAIIVFTVSIGIQGFANILILVIPQQLILLTCMCLSISYNFGSSRIICRYRPSNSVVIVIKPVFCFFIISLSNILLQIVLIYVIIRPFNILI